MPEIVLITSCSHVLTRLYEGPGQSTLAEASDPAPVPCAHSAPASVSSSGKLGLGFAAIMSTKAMKSDQLRGQHYPISLGYFITVKKLRNLQKYRGNQSWEKLVDFFSVLQ